MRISNKRNKNYNDILENGKGLIEFYNENPCIAAYELLGVDLAPIQRLIFEDMWFKNYVIIVAARGLGKTFLLGTLAALSCMLKPGYRVGLIGPVFRQSLVINSSTYDISWTSSGMKSTTTELYSSVVPNITQIQSLNKPNTILSSWENDDRACRWIKTTKGFEIAGTCDHGILVLDDNNDLVFKDLEDIKTDYIAIKTGFNYFNNNNSMPTFNEFKHDWRTKNCLEPKELTSDLAYWMGLLVGDGCISVSKNKRKQRVNFVSEDQDLLDSFEGYLREYFLVDKEENITRRNRKNNTWEMEYYCKKLAQYLLKCGFTKTTAIDKKVPDVIKKASRDIFIAFLQALYDTDGCIYIQKCKACEITFNTSSKQLAKEVHAILLNLGIVSNLTIGNKACVKKLKVGNKLSVCSTGYKIRITGKEFLKRFSAIIGFRCVRKKEKLESYLNNHLKNNFGLSRTIGVSEKKISSNYNKFHSYREQGIYFVKMVDSEYMFAPTMDIEVENEHCYWANGFINHNSKMIFSEVEKLYIQSSILREACERQPIKASDACYLRFKSVAGMTPSYIEALPLGTDGSKIRGSRFYLILADELAQIPDQVLDKVIRPMGATSLAPMEKVRRKEQQKRLIALGVATADNFEEETVNKMVMTSSGYYKFNHMWKRMKDHWSQMALSESRGEVCKYSIWQVPYQDLPEGFLDKNNIDEARRIMSSSEFQMEYEAAMISDSEGFFKASLLEACTTDSGYTVEYKGTKGCQYILGVDPNQGGKASTGVVIIKLGNINKIVNVLELKRKNTQELTKIVQDLCKTFNVTRIFMDKGGGGKAICDLLEDGYGGEEPMIDRTNEDHKHLKGRHILELVNFNPSWISDANFTTKSMLEDKKLLFPEVPTSTLDLDAKNYETIDTLKSQMLNIIVSQTPSGALHFDTPTKGQNKDLYSAIILVAHGARMLEKELEAPSDPILYNIGGLVRPRDISNKDFNTIQRVTSESNKTSSLNAALLKKRLK